MDAIRTLPSLGYSLCPGMCIGIVGGTVMILGTRGRQPVGENGRSTNQGNGSEAVSYLNKRRYDLAISGFCCFQ